MGGQKKKKNKNTLAEKNLYSKTRVRFRIRNGFAVFLCYTYKKLLIFSEKILYIKIRPGETFRHGLLACRQYRAELRLCSTDVTWLVVQAGTFL